MSELMDPYYNLTTMVDGKRNVLFLQVEYYRL
jgi:hypothetical protein